LLGLAAVALPSVASATECTTLPCEVKIVKFKAKAVPIPKPGGGTYPETGNIFGAGAAVEAEYEFSGSGYGVNPKNTAGGIAPLSGVNFYLPAGTVLHPAGFGTCTKEVLEKEGPLLEELPKTKGCPAKSVASPVGSAEGEVTFGETRVPETATLQGFFAPGGGLLFFTKGSNPVSLEIISEGKYVSASSPYGKELITVVPPVKGPPGAALASVKTIKIKAGSAYKKGKEIVPYGRIPLKCPKGGFPIKTEVKFGGPEFGIAEKSLTAEIKTPCPTKHLKKKHK